MSLTKKAIDSDDDDDTASTSTTKTNKKRKASDSSSQTNLDEHYDNFPTSLSKEDQINTALVKMFVYCNLPFSLIEYPFFIEFIKSIHNTYSFSSRWVLSNTLFDQEIFRINLKLEKLLTKKPILQLSLMVGQISLDNRYNYCLITKERKEYL